MKVPQHLELEDVIAWGLEAILVELGLELLRHTDWLGGPTSDFVSGLVLITLLFLLFKIPFAAYHWAFRHPLSGAPLQVESPLPEDMTRLLAAARGE